VLYSLKEAPRLRHSHIDAFLSTIRFTRSTSDPNLYILVELVGGYLFLLLYMDDLLIANPCRAKVNPIKKLLSNKYRMTDLGLAHQFLSIGIYRLPGSIHLSQEICGYNPKAISDGGLQWSGYTHGAGNTTPARPGLKLARSGESTITISAAR
jgi:hypothetical protein